MDGERKISRTELALILLTAIFLVLLATVRWGGGTTGASYTIDTELGAGQEEITVQKVDVNTAGLDELQTLPGIGPVLAQRIIDWRNAGGVFSVPEDLLEISGIGPATLDDIRDLIITKEAT